MFPPSSSNRTLAFNILSILGCMYKRMMSAKAHRHWGRLSSHIAVGILFQKSSQKSIP